MRYLRMLSNSVVVGLVAAVYLAQLVLLLNPAVPLTIGASAPVLAVMTLSYGVHIAAFTYVAFVVRQMARLEPLWPAWVSLRMLAWTSGVASAAVAALLWLNVGGLRTALDLATLQALTQGAVIMSVASALMLVLALTRTYVQRAPVVVAALFTTLALVSIAAPLSLRGGRAPREVSAPATSAMALPAVPGDPRVVALLLDGASLDIITPAVAAGRLPNFARLLESGASMHLATTRPTQAEQIGRAHV